MDLQKLKKDLMSKGIFVVASTNEITAGLAWSVEGIDKVPKLGELLFYKVNGVEYGVKPKKGNKHDIHWYYDQLKTGMKGAKGYSAGLTQFLNAWVKKGELVIVFKSNKATASVTSAKRLSSQEKCDSIINGIKNGSINGDELFKTITKEYNLTPDCVAATRWLIKEWGQEDIQNNNEWPIRFRKLYNLHGVKFLNKYLNDLLLDSRSELSGGSSESILDGLYKKFKGDKVVASPQLVSETGIDNLLLSEMSLKANKWNHGATGICWDIVLKVNKVLVIEYREDEGTANLTYRNGSAKKDIKGIKTIADLRDKIEEYLIKFDANKATAASPRKYRPSIRERMDRDSYLDPMEYPIENRDYAKKFNKFKKEVQDIEVFGFKPFYVRSDIDKEPNDEDFNIHTIIELRNTEIKLEPISSEKEKLIDVLNTLNEKYKFKVLDIDGLSISFDAFISNNCSGNSHCFEIRNSKDFDWFLQNLRMECKLLEKVIKPFSDVTVTASKKVTDATEEQLKGFEKFKKELEQIEFLGKKPFTAKLKADPLLGEDAIKVFTKDNKLLAEITECPDVHSFIKDAKKFNDNWENNILCFEIKDSIIVLFEDGEGGCVYGYVEGFDFDWYLKRLKTNCKEIKDIINKYKGIKVTASTDANKVKELINKINGLVIDGKKAFEATSTDDGVCIKLLLKKWNADNDYDVVGASEDSLRIIFPVTEKWAKADNSTNLKAGDITLYTDEYMSSQFNSELCLEKNSSKVDFDNLDAELKDVYEALKADCYVLNGLKNVKVTADTVTVEVKETAEVNEENFEGINEEHDRLLFTKVTPEKFLNLWKTSKNFNGSQIQKIIYGFKLASRTLGSKFENKGILIEYFYSKKYGKGYIRVEYDKDLYIIYVSRSEDNGEVKVITRKMRKVIPTKNFNILSTSVSSLAFERSNLPSGFKPIWEEVSK